MAKRLAENRKESKCTMSVKIMGAVWDADLPRDEKFVLLAFADHADHDGGNIYPSIGRIAWKTGYSERQIIRITKKLTDKSILILTNDGVGGRNITNSYRIDVNAIPARTDYTKKSDKMSVFTEEKGDILSEKGDICDIKGDIAMSPEPSLTVLKPSINKRAVKSALSSPGGDPRTNSPEIKAYRHIVGRNPPKVQYDRIIRAFAGKSVEDIQTVYEAWCKSTTKSGKPYNPNNYGWIDWVEDGIPMRGESARTFWSQAGHSAGEDKERWKGVKLSYYDPNAEKDGQSPN